MSCSTICAPPKPRCSRVVSALALSTRYLRSSGVPLRELTAKGEVTWYLREPATPAMQGHPDCARGSFGAGCHCN